jgi:CBS domain-containing protein
MPEKTLENRSVKDICSLVTAEASVVREDCSWDDLLVELLEHPCTRHVYVVDDHGTLVGAVRLGALMKRLFPFASQGEQGETFSSSPEASFDAETAGDMMLQDPCCVTEETSVGELIGMMTRENVSELPVVDDRGRVIGEVNVLEVIAGYLRAKDD